MVLISMRYFPRYYNSAIQIENSILKGAKHFWWRTLLFTIWVLDIKLGTTHIYPGTHLTSPDYLVKIFNPPTYEFLSSAQPCTADVMSKKPGFFLLAFSFS